MTTKTLLLVLVLALALQPQPLRAQLNPGHPLAGLERLKDFETRRDSSSDANWRSGNDDRRKIEPGGTLTVAELAGPGVITHIWNTVAHAAPNYSALLTLRIYWDGEKHPSIECPLGDFFGIGMGVDQPFTSLPIRVSADGRARNCYWPMPFRKSARITVTNESDVPCRAFYFYVDWQKHESLPAETAYFHAMYRQEFPCVMGRNYLLADLEGRGHYVGTVQSVYHSSPGWYGEGDDFFFIDGESEPSLRGTGTEDYFSDGWGFRQQDGPFYGTPLWEGFNPGDRGTAYRWHIPDPIAFRKSLRVEIEHKGSQNFADGKYDGFIERDDLMSSVAFWYQTEPHKPWPALPAGRDRLPFQETMLARGASAEKQATPADHAPLATAANPAASGGKFLECTPADDRGWLEVRFETTQEMNAELRGRMIRSYSGGKYRVSLDGAELGTVDFYGDLAKPSAHHWGLRKLAAGNHVLRFDCVGKTAGSAGHHLGFDTLTARVPVYSRPAGFDLRKNSSAAVAAPAAPPPATPPPAGSAVRIDAGAQTSLTDAAGNPWLSDRGFVGGECAAREDDMKIGNTKDAGIYRTEHWGMSSFSQPLQNGRYVVKLHFAETYDGVIGPGGRVFSFNVEGREFRDFDVWAKAGGPRRAYVEIVSVDITDGKLDVTFESGVDEPEINGIEIIPAP